MDEIKEIEGKLKLVREATGLNNLQYCKTHKTIILPFMRHYPCCLLSKIKELEDKYETPKEAIKFFCSKCYKPMFRNWDYLNIDSSLTIRQVADICICSDCQLKLIEKEKP